MVIGYLSLYLIICFHFNALDLYNLFAYNDHNTRLANFSSISYSTTALTPCLHLRPTWHIMNKVYRVKNYIVYRNKGAVFVNL